MIRLIPYGRALLVSLLPYHREPFTERQRTMKIFDKLSPVLRNIHAYFGFLFEQGYIIRYKSSKQRRMVFWDVILESPKCLIHLFQDRNEICLTLAPSQEIIINEKEIVIQDQIGIQIIIYYLSNGKEFVGIYDKDFYRDKKKQFRTLADLLNKHYDQIMTFYENKIPESRGALLLAAKEYNDLLIQRYVHEHRKRGTYDVGPN